MNQKVTDRRKNGEPSQFFNSKPRKSHDRIKTWINSRPDPVSRYRQLDVPNLDKKDL
uniref:Uncharacterized protein n=1 Tax=Rhizophora mucronata TaxID=61149 RepID=A0A2P2ITQ3_RHIMU